jgi:hypothetical protein
MKSTLGTHATWWRHSFMFLFCMSGTAKFTARLNAVLNLEVCRINYPYLTNPAFKAAADSCHSLGLKFSVYNTMRELSDRCVEYYAMLVGLLDILHLSSSAALTH